MDKLKRNSAAYKERLRLAEYIIDQMDLGDIIAYAVDALEQDYAAHSQLFEEDMELFGKEL